MSATQLFATQQLGSGDVSEVNSIACPSAGDCSAVGAYSDAAGNTQPFVLDETDHVWSRAIEVPGVQALNDNVGATLTTIPVASLARVVPVATTPTRTATPRRSWSTR